jgi:hypothetical protein
VFCKSLFVLLLAIVLSVLRFTASDYPFGIFKHFFVLFRLVDRLVFFLKLIEGQIIQWPKEGQTMIYKTLHRKLKIEQHEPHKNGGEFKRSRRVNSSTHYFLYPFLCTKEGSLYFPVMDIHNVLCTPEVNCFSNQEINVCIYIMRI